MNMIDELKKNLKMEVRTKSQEEEYFEAVIEKASLEPLNLILINHFGKAAKEPGRNTKFPKDIDKIVDSLGGLRIDQSFFYQKEGSKVHYAMLWPWQSDPEKITLKIGVIS